MMQRMKMADDENNGINDDDYMMMVTTMVCGINPNGKNIKLCFCTGLNNHYYLDMVPA